MVFQTRHFQTRLLFDFQAKDFQNSFIKRQTNIRDLITQVQQIEKGKKKITPLTKWEIKVDNRKQRGNQIKVTILRTCFNPDPFSRDLHHSTIFLGFKK